MPIANGGIACENVPVRNAGTDPSIVVISRRGSSAEPFRCGGYEFEDVVAEVSAATMVLPERGRFGAGLQRIGSLVQRRTGGRLAGPRSYRRPTRATDRADLLIVRCQLPQDVNVVLSLGDLSRWADKSICYLEELYIDHFDHFAGVVSLFDRFDAVFLGMEDTALAWQSSLRVPVTYLPFSVDALRFAPKVVGGPRPIAVMNIGRRSEVTHQALYDWSRRTSRLYYFDSMKPGPVRDFGQHRSLMADMLGHSSIAISNRGVGSDPAETSFQYSTPPRYFEAAAAGAVLVGLESELPGMEANFGWADSHISMSLDEPDAGQIVQDLLDQPDRLAAASRRNVVESLRRHDHLHRIDTILEAVGLAAGPRAEPRRQRLAEVARHHETAPVGTIVPYEYGP